jgi:hypothetical protein
VIPPDLSEIDKFIIEDDKHFVIERVRETLVFFATLQT